MADRIQDLGVFTAYGEAREAGYEGSKAEFEEGLKKAAEYTENAQASAEAAAASADDAELSAAGAAESAEDAETSAGEATQSATDAAASAGAAAGSANAASASATQAASNAQAALGDIAPVFDATKAYNVGDYVIYTDGKLYRFIADHAAGAWVGTDAEATVIGDEVSELKSAIDDVIDKGFVLTNITGVFGVVKLEDRSFLAENQNQRIVGQSTSTYDSYYFYTSADAAAYFASANQDSPSYVAITVGYNPTKEWVNYSGSNIGMACSSALRKRNTESNLPVQELPLDISYAIVIITVEKTKTTELYLNSGIFIRDSVEYPRLEQEIQDIGDKLSAFDAAAGTVTGYGNKLIVRINNAQYEVRHVTDQTTRTDTWRVFSGAILARDSYEMLWNGQDADGVVKLLGEDDFIGGFHGDEIIRENGDAFYVYIDGVKQASMTFGQKTFREMVVYQESDIYHCNTSSASANVAFIRNKAIVFNKEGLKIKNYWIAQETVNVIRAFFGMLTVLLYQSDGASIMCNGFSTDVDYAYNPANTTTALSPNMREVIMHSAFGDIIIKMSNNTETNYRGYVHYYNTGDLRSKAYLGPVYNDSGITLNANDVLRGETLIQVRK